MKFRRQLIVFLLVGAIATLIDLVIYISLTNFRFSENYAKALSFLCGTIFGYFGNSKFTFSNSRGNLSRYLFVYFFSFLFNIGINHLTLSIKSDRLLGWSLATLTSTAMNFFGLRNFAFTRKV